MGCSGSLTKSSIVIDNNIKEEEEEKKNQNDLDEQDNWNIDNLILPKTCNPTMIIKNINKNNFDN